MNIALRYIPVEWRFVILAGAAAVLMLGCGIYTGLQLHAPTITQTVHSLRPVRSLSDVQQALGQPQGQVAVSGHTCSAWQVQGGYILTCP